MSQKFTKLQNNNKKSTAYGKWFATAVYDQRFVETEELANYIQQQASVKKSDIKAVLDELGGAMKHYFELGQKVKLDGIGIFKVGFSSIGAADKVDCTAATITTITMARMFLTNKPQNTRKSISFILLPLFIITMAQYATVHT